VLDDEEGAAAFDEFAEGGEELRLRSEGRWWHPGNSQVYAGW